jgi:hypothetical protein
MPDQMCRGGKFIFIRIKEAKADGWRCHDKEVVSLFSLNKRGESRGMEMSHERGSAILFFGSQKRT